MELKYKDTVLQYVSDKNYDSWKEQHMSELLRDYVNLEHSGEFENYCKAIYDYDVNGVDFIEEGEQ